METGKPGAGIVCPSLIDSRLDLSENLNSVQMCFSEFLSLLPSFLPSLPASLPSLLSLCCIYYAQRESSPIEHPNPDVHPCFSHPFPSSHPQVLDIVPSDVTVPVRYEE